MVSKEINLGTTALVLALLSVHTANGLCTSNCSACVLEYTPPFTVVYNASKARPDLAGQTFSISSSDSAGISNTVPKYFIIQGGIVKINNATNLSRNDIALNVFGNTILPVIYRFTVLVFTNPLASFSISICIQGLDNNIPTFPRSEVQIVVLEGTILSWPMDFAVDNDEGENSTQSYSILSNDSAVMSELYLDIARNSYNKITSILLSSNVSLDPGRKPNYNFTMVAQEGRPNTPKGYQKVYVIVQYLCNSLPTFEAPMYQISLPLSSPINTSVTTLRAVHMYSSTAAPIYYSIADICITGQLVQCSSNLRPFALNYTSGSLILTSALDYNQGRQFNITVVAKDACNLIGSTLVLVQITATPPIIQVILSNNGSIHEDYPLTSNVASVTVSSPDHLNVSLVVLDSTTKQVSDTFYISGIGIFYHLRLLQALNSKIRNGYYITIQASDPANNVIHSTFNITVVAANHPPIFLNKTAFIYIPYNTGSGVLLLQVCASDSDVGDNGIVTYGLPPPNVTFPYQNFFSINNISGDVMVKGVLNKTFPQSIILLVMAKDNPTDGESYLSDYMTINILLMDVDRSKAPIQIQPSKISIFNKDLNTGTYFMSQISVTGVMQSFSDLSTQTLMPVSSIHFTQANTTFALPITIITIVATLTAMIVLVFCITGMIIMLCFHIKQRGKVTLTTNPCDRLELQTASVQCSDIQCAFPAKDKDLLQQPSPPKQLDEHAHYGVKGVINIQSTSDLASTVSTNIIADTESIGPYSKAQLMAIYAANVQLLSTTGSQNSIHMFGSEGGIEADEIDLSNLSFDGKDADSIHMDDGVTNNDDVTYKYGTLPQPSICPGKMHAAMSVDMMNTTSTCNRIYQNASQSMPSGPHQHWSQGRAHILKNQEYCSDTGLSIQQKYYRCDSASFVNSEHSDYQQVRKYSIPNHKAVQHIIQPDVSIPLSSPDHPSGYFCTNRFPPSAIHSHNYPHSLTHFVAETDNSTLSSEQTNRAPERYYSNISLGSTNSSQPVP